MWAAERPDQQVLLRLAPIVAVVNERSISNREELIQLRTLTMEKMETIEEDIKELKVLVKEIRDK